VPLRQKAHFFIRTCSSHEWLVASLATTGHELGLSRGRSGGTDLKQHRRVPAREKTCIAELLPRVWRMQGGGGHGKVHTSLELCLDVAKHSQSMQMLTCTVDATPCLYAGKYVRVAFGHMANTMGLH
jgi:hypothetical protein